MRLIETLLLQDGRYPLQEEHLARMARSAAALRMRLTRRVVLSALAEIRRARPYGAHKVRLTLDRHGVVETTCTSLCSPAAGPLRGPLSLRVYFEDRIDPHDPLVRHKTTWRSLYQRAMAAHPDADDVLLTNTRGELTEGCWNSLFLEQGGTLLTPPVASGCLPGVLRARLLAQGAAKETPFGPQDLENGTIYMGNAVRGLRRAVLLR